MTSILVGKAVTDIYSQSSRTSTYDSKKLWSFSEAWSTSQTNGYSPVALLPDKYFFEKVRVRKTRGNGKQVGKNINTVDCSVQNIVGVTYKSMARAHSPENLHPLFDGNKPLNLIPQWIHPSMKANHSMARRHRFRFGRPWIHRNK